MPLSLGLGGVPGYNLTYPHWELGDKSLFFPRLTGCPRSIQERLIPPHPPVRSPPHPPY